MIQHNDRTPGQRAACTPQEYREYIAAHHGRPEVPLSSALQESIQRALHALAVQAQVQQQRFEAAYRTLAARLQQEAWRKYDQPRPVYRQLVNAQALAELFAVYCPPVHKPFPGLTVNPEPRILHWTRQLAPGLRNPRAALELRRRAAEQQTSPKELLRTKLFPEAIVLVSNAAGTPQRMRLGRRWVTDAHGKAPLVTPREVSVGALLRWFQSQVYTAATAILLGEQYPRPTRQPGKLLLCGEDALERLAVPASPGARESAMLANVLDREEMDPVDQCDRLLAGAPPRVRELLLWLLQGMSRQQAADRMELRRSTVDVMMFRLKHTPRR